LLANQQSVLTQSKISVVLANGQKLCRFGTVDCQVSYALADVNDSTLFQNVISRREVKLGTKEDFVCVA
jgi:hypothetical protein